MPASTRRNPSLLQEIGRLFDAKTLAVACEVSRGKVFVDGHAIRTEHDRRWPQARIAGRMVVFVGREARLFDDARHDGQATSG